MKISAIVPAAGSGSRFGINTNKLLEEIDGIPIIVRTLKVLSECDKIFEIIIPTSPNMTDILNEYVIKYHLNKVKKIILGGETRQESVFNALKACEKPDYVLIHDGARPLISLNIINNAIKIALDKGSAVVAVPVKDTIKVVDNDIIVDTPDRSTLWQVQTPQIFIYSDLLHAHEKFQHEFVTDDAALIEKIGNKVYIEMGSYKNLKVTTPEDLVIARALVE